MTCSWLLVPIALSIFSSSAPVDLNDVTDVVAIGPNLGGFQGPIVSRDGFGDACADIGDLDGDGLSELAVGADTDDGGGQARGAVHVLFRNADGTVRAEHKISADSGDLNNVLDDLDFFGSSITGIGDLNGDGIPDVAVGAPGDRGGGRRGALYLLMMRMDGSVRSFIRIANAGGGFGGHLAAGDNFGVSVACLGDLNGDGAIELAVGADGTADPGFSVGAVWLLSVDDGGVVQERRLDGNSGWGGTIGQGDRFGRTLAALGDLDGNGVCELAVSATEGTSVIGRIWILFLDRGGDVIDFTELDEGTDPLLAGILVDGADLGLALAGVGDLNGDGAPDLAAGILGLNDGSGSIALLYLTRAGTVVDLTLIDEQQGVLAPELTDGSGLGQSMCWLQDEGSGWLFSGISEHPTTMGPPRLPAVLALRFCDGGVDADFSASVTAGDAPLTVAFENLSQGTITGWDWSFGDGGASTLEHPVHVYRFAGTFDVQLTVNGPSGTCVDFQRELVVASATDPVTSRNGTGVNPEVFSSSSDPLVGAVWPTVVDGTGLGFGGLSFLFVFDAPLAGFLTERGEILIDPTSAVIAIDVQLFAAEVASHAIAVPDDAALVGLAYSCQALAGTPGVLTNALDIILGTG